MRSNILFPIFARLVCLGSKFFKSVVYELHTVPCIYFRDSLLLKECRFYKAQTNDVDWSAADGLLTEIFKFSSSDPSMRDITSAKEKICLLVHSLPANCLLLLPTQIAFKVTE